MSVGKNKHPLYTARFEEWTQMSDTYSGQAKVKESGTKYLPATSGHIEDGFPNPNSVGYKAYTAYVTRAVFPEFVKDSVARLIGLMHRKPANIELTPRLEGLRERATASGESLQSLLRRVNTQQLVSGRVGLLLDVPDGQTVDKALPYIATYDALDILNWGSTILEGNHKLNFVVLNETGPQLNPTTLAWQEEERYIIARLGASGSYEVASVGKDAQLTAAQFREVQIGGNKLDVVPFTFINASDLVPDPDSSPLLSLSNTSLTIYRGEADYRQGLFMQGQDTLVVVGATVATNADGSTDELRIGAGGRIDLPQGGEAYYIGVESDGLSEMRSALENDRKSAESIGSSLLDFGEGQDASGEALRVRVAANTASLVGIARVGAEGLQNALRQAAQWLGEDPSKVIVEPNTDFAASELTGAELLSYVSAKNMGAPMSRKTIHDLMRRKELTTKTFEEEVAELEEEEPMGVGAEDDADN